jgi:hypothetical protein
MQSVPHKRAWVNLQKGNVKNKHSMHNQQDGVLPKLTKTKIDKM